MRSSRTELRARQAVDSYLARLRVSDARLTALSRVEREAPVSARARLEELHRAGAEEVDRGLALLEDLAGKLTVLSFSGLSASTAVGAERELVEDLLLRIEALAEMTAETS